MQTEVWEVLDKTYKPKIIEVAGKLREKLIEQGFECSEVDDFTDEDLWVYFVINPNEEEKSVDVSFWLMDAAKWDGTENGTSFKLDCVEWGGRLLGSLTPYNYTDKVWVDPTDLEAVEERWQEFVRGIDAEAVIESLCEA